VGRDGLVTASQAGLVEMIGRLVTKPGIAGLTRSPRTPGDKARYLHLAGIISETPQKMSENKHIDNLICLGSY